jgi:hypothetical protein
MIPTTILALILTPWSGLAQETTGGTTDVPIVSVNAKAEVLSDVLAGLQDQAGALIVAEPFAGRRRVTVEITDAPLPVALDQLAIAGVSSWDSAYILVPEGGPYGPQDTPPGWNRPAQTTLSLLGGSGTVDDITRALTNKCAAPVGYLPELEETIVSTQPAEDAPLEDVLGQVNGDNLAWTRGFWLAPIDRAAVFGRYASLPPEQREEAVLRHTEQMLRLNEEDVRQALEARHRQFSSLDAKERADVIQRYADQVRDGIGVLNMLSTDARKKARDAMRVFFDIGLEVYRDLTEEEQIETTPIIEAMGELER